MLICKQLLWMSTAMNISSVIVIPNPSQVEAVIEQLIALPGVELAAQSDEGKLIITIESEGDRENIQMYERISVLDGVLSAAMVYHQQEDAPEEEIALAA